MPLLRFVRSLVGMDREAAKEALGGFLYGKSLDPNQIEFISAIIDHLTEHGYVPAELLYELLYTDFNPQGVEGVFPPEQVDELITGLEAVRRRAVASPSPSLSAFARSTSSGEPTRFRPARAPAPPRSV